jgi:hypothetical protein
MARRLPRRAFSTARNDKFRIIMARGLVPRGHLDFYHYERSINCHRERSVAISGEEIASVTTFLRNDKKLAASSVLSSRT